MPEPDESLTDSVDAMLGTDAQASAGDAPLRAMVLSQTVRVIRFRRRLRRCGLAAALLGCYLAGAATVARWGLGRDNSPRPSTEQVTSAPPAPSGVSRQVATVKMSRFEALRREGDHSLLEEGDVQAALRDYKRAIDLASTEERAIAPGQDTWLLMALKDARTKENIHAHVEQN